MKRINGVLVDENGVELVPMPPGYMELLRERDPLKLAVKTFEERAYLKPNDIPAQMLFSNPEVLKAWRLRGTPVSTPNAREGEPDFLKSEFNAWLKASVERTDALDEARRRVRSAMWCEAILRRSAKHKDMAAQMAEFNREHWRVIGVPDDSIEREHIVPVAVSEAAKRQEARR